MAKNWIAGAIKKPGSLRKSLGVKEGETIPTKKLAAAASKGGKLGTRTPGADLTQTTSVRPLLYCVYWLVIFGLVWLKLTAIEANTRRQRLR
jgi:hypothetical protein